MYRRHSEHPTYKTGKEPPCHIVVKNTKFEDERNHIESCKKEKNHKDRPIRKNNSKILTKIPKSQEGLE